MHLFKSDIRILETLKKVQKSEECYVYVDIPNKRAYFSTSYYHDAVINAVSTNDYVSIESHNESISASLRYLEKHGLISTIGPSVYQVTHLGWFNKEVMRRELIHSLITHILFPSIVALVTTLLALFFTQ